MLKLRDGREFIPNRTAGLHLVGEIKGVAFDQPFQTVVMITDCENKEAFREAWRSLGCGGIVDENGDPFEQ